MVPNATSSVVTSTPASTSSTKSLDESKVSKKDSKTDEKIVRFLIMGVGIFKKEESVNCEQGACYKFKGTGNVVSSSENKIYLLTASHIFTEKSEEYAYINRVGSGGVSICPFKFSSTQGVIDSMVDMATIPIGYIDPVTKKYVQKTNSEAPPKWHCHYDKNTIIKV